MNTKGVAVVRPWDTAMADRACRYTLGRQTPDGGFCFYRAWGVEEPNAPDTYFAIAALRWLGADVPDRERCATWLQAQQHGSGDYSTLVIGWATLSALRLVGAPPRRGPDRFLDRIARDLGPPASEPDSRAPALSTASPTAATLLDIWRSVEVLQTWGGALDLAIRDALARWLCALPCTGGGFGSPGPNLVDTAIAVELADALGVGIASEVCVYASRCEGEPWGFNVTPEATSTSIEVQRAGTRLFQRFGRRPTDCDRIRRYISGCQTDDGGFSRALGAIPTLKDTLDALETLACLAEIERAGAHPDSF